VAGAIAELLRRCFQSITPAVSRANARAHLGGRERPIAGWNGEAGPAAAEDVPE